MARAHDRLSARRVATLTKPGLYSDGANLYLQIGPTGTKSWLFRFELAGKRHDMGLGSAGTFTLAEARERAKQARQLLADGINPLEHRRAAVAARRAQVVLTFDDCAARYIASHESGWRNPKHAGQWRSTLATYASPVIGSMSVAEIETAHVMRILEPIWSTKAETASRLRGRVEAVLDWAKVQGYRDGESPARWRGHLDKLLPARAKVARVQHHPALPWREVSQFMQELRTMPGTAARALEFIILTAARTGEAIGATWQEIDLDRRIWTVPAERMKAAREHVVPLSDAAVEVLQAQAAEHGAQGFIFPGKAGPLSNMACLQLLKRMGRADLTVHGFRSTFRDWAGEATAHPREVIEHALAHQLKDKAEAAYQRGDLLERRRILMADWAAWCDQPAASADVVPLRGAA